MSASAETPGGEVRVYEAADGEVRVDVRLEQETVWLSQAQMAELFGRERSVITKHVNNVFGEGELGKESNVQNVHIASSDKPIAFYSLDVIISVGYRVKSKRGTQFRIWATRTLRDHLLRGYTLNERRLREKGFGEIEQGAHGHAYRRARVVQALAHHRGRAPSRSAPARASGRNRRSLRTAALSRPRARFHRLRGRWRRARGEEDGGLSPVPRGAGGGGRDVAGRGVEARW